eukprot:TRINITY_DN22130_c0_g1_i1.p1 TRINITY_DN22130_c0_g1~~TRINITY_DN22130_c0_g1_i1.p1  ORF type:complete len:283 (-),score=35.22 TRINITY_DN22130_c0_g1_i1:911-1759(-)
MASSSSKCEDFVEICNKRGTPIKMPRLGLGTFQVSPADAEEAILFALGEGYRHIDTAQLFRNEAAVGRAVRASGIPREEIFVSTKLWNSDHGYQQALQAFDRSLQTLGLDYVDLYLIQSPMRVDARLESWRALEDILASGRARAIGVSNYGVHHLDELLANCTVRPAVNQIEVHPFNTRSSVIAYCQRKEIAVQAYSALTKGRRLKDPIVLEIASRCSMTPAQVLLRWSLQRGLCPLVKSTNQAHIVSNLQVYKFELKAADMQTLDACNEDYPTGWDPVNGP